MTRFQTSNPGGHINGKGRRAKGAEGEREFLRLLAEELRPLGFPVPEGGFQRNLEQTRHGGFDNHNEDSLSQWAIEIRRRETPSLGAWWKDVCQKADELNRVPVIAYRQNRKPWQVLVPFYVSEFSLKDRLTDEYMQMSISCFARLVDYHHCPKV